MPNKIFKVHEVNRYIKDIFTKDFLLSRISIEGEVSNCKYHSSGHVYFTLKDDQAAIQSVMFKSYAQTADFKLTDGMKLVADGSISLYEKSGSYQLYVRQIAKVGLGELYVKYVQLNEKLKKEGLFAVEHKQSLPSYIRRLGIVTSPTGAAIQDICQITRRRNPYVQLVLYPALVQGEAAVPSLIEGIRYFNRYQSVDCLLIGRGGGSLEDLWAFNDERLAREVYQSDLPVISAVGHETDFCILDFVADVRAATPSAGAELAVTDINEIEAKLAELGLSLRRNARRSLLNYRQKLTYQQQLIASHHPRKQLDRWSMDLLALETELQKRLVERVTERRKRLMIYREKLEGLSPVRLLQSGYAYLENNHQQRISSIDQVKTGEQVVAYLADGRLDLQVNQSNRWEGNLNDKSE